MATVSGLVVAAGGGALVCWWQWRGGADRLWSQRLNGTTEALFGMTLFVLMILLLFQPPVVWLFATMGVLVPSTLVLEAAAHLVQCYERERTRRERRALGYAVPPRMVPPLLLAALWMLATMTTVAVTLGESMLTVGPDLVRAVPVRMDTELVVAAALGGLLGGGHGFWQHHRRECARRRVDEHNLRRVCVCPLGATTTTMF